jgi:hypothetical protein
MPFGKYKDWPIDEIPADYLRWVVDKTRREELGLTQEEFAERAGNSPHLTQRCRTWDPQHLLDQHRARRLCLVNSGL